MRGRLPSRRLFRFPWRTAAQVAEDVDEELQFHLDKVTQELIEERWLPEAAQAEALRRFGDLEGTRTYYREVDRGKERQMQWKQTLEAIGQDLRFAGQQLWKSPGFTLIVMLTLALAVGATTSIFSVVNGVLLQPLPFAQPERLVRVFPLDHYGNRDVFSPPNFTDWAAASHRIGAAAAWNRGTFNLSGGEPERLRGASVGARTPLLVLFGAVLSVLLIACVNVANLLLVRAAAREGEVAVRTALGAGRGRIVRQLLTESLLLAFAGGAAGVGLAFYLTRTLVALAPPQTPRLEEVGLDSHVLLFALAVALVTGVLFGLAPALQASRPDLVAALKEGSRGSKGHAGARARNVLVIAEVALAVVLLAGAGLLLRSFAQLQKAELGFRPESAVTFSLSLPDAKYPDDPQLWAFMDRLVEKMKALPGVTAAGAGTYAMPLNSSVFVLSFKVDGGRPPLPPGQDSSMRVALVTPDFLRTLAIPILRGRSFDGRDRDGAPQVALLNEVAVRRFFPGEEPLGKRIVLGWSRNGVRRGGEVVGIVGDYRQGALEKEADPQIYLPFAQAPMGDVSVVLRTAADPSAVSAAARAQVRELDPALPLAGLQTLDEVVTASASQPRFYLLLLGGFAVIALVLAAVGIYGVITYAVRQRTQEIGIRMALGATRHRVQRMVVGQGLILAGLGAAAGLAGALFATRGLRSLLYQVSAADPAIYALVALVLVLVAALASYLPARRAARTEPQLAIRSES